MAQPMTLIATPDPDDNPHACPAYCDGTCDEWDGTYHTSGFTLVNVQCGDGEDTEVSVSVSREDIDGEIGDPQLHLLSMFGARDDLVLTAENARELAAALLNAADDVDPLPDGVTAVPAGQVRIGDEIDTPDGWQTVNGLLFFRDADQAALFTPEKDDIDSDGYQHSMLDPIRVRRPLNGSCAVPFVEPIANVGGAR